MWTISYQAPSGVILLALEIVVTPGSVDILFIEEVTSELIAKKEAKVSKEEVKEDYKVVDKELGRLR